eukprot:15463105-Alexandrium_andersonii.AAC.1
MWQRGLSGVTTTSPPRAAGIAVAARPPTAGRGARVGRRASPALPTGRREAAQRMSPLTRLPRARLSRVIPKWTALP